MVLNNELFCHGDRNLPPRVLEVLEAVLTINCSPTPKPNHLSLEALKPEAPPPKPIIRNTMKEVKRTKRMSRLHKSPTSARVVLTA